MTTEIDRTKTIGETPGQTGIRLAEQMTRLVDQRIDLERIKREGIYPAWHSMASGFQGTLKEAVCLNDYALFNTWRQILGTNDNLLASIVEQERERLRNFFNQPLDDR